VWNRFCPEAAGGRGARGVVQTMYTHVSKCKNGKTKKKYREIAQFDSKVKQIFKILNRFKHISSENLTWKYVVTNL
jgi:hypothetical protein